MCTFCATYITLHICALCRYVQMRFYFYNCKSPYEHLSRANTDIEQLEVQVHWLLVRLPNQVSSGQPVALAPTASPFFEKWQSSNC